MLNTVAGDILMCIIVVPLRVVHVYNVFWWTRGSCIIYVVLKYTPLFVSMNTVVLIAIERCVAVVLPAKFAAFASRRNVKIHLALVWSTALVEMIYPFAVVKVSIKRNALVTHKDRPWSVIPIHLLNCIVELHCLIYLCLRHT